MRTRSNRCGIDPIYLTIEGIPTSPVDRDVLKAHLAVDGTSLDSLISLYEIAAVTWAENTMKRNILSRNCVWSLADFPLGEDETIRLPRGLCTTVDRISYSFNGARVELNGPSGGSPGTGFQEELSSDSGGILMPNRGYSWPSVDTDVPSPVLIYFTAGWRTSDDVPVDIKHAIMFAVADLLEVRSIADVATLQSIVIAGKTTDIRDSLLSPYRLERFY